MPWYGALPIPGSAAQAVVARNADGRLEAFFTGDGDHIYHTWQIAPNSLIWSPPVAFPGASAKQVVVGSNADGRLEIFYIGTNNHLYHNWQSAPADAAADPGTVNSWAGETTFVNQSANYVTVGLNADGRLEIFYLGTGGDLYHDWQTAPARSSDAATALNSWNGETPFKGNSAAQIAVAGNIDGRLEIFYVGTNGDLFHNWQTAVPISNNPSTFNEWARTDCGGRPSGLKNASRRPKPAAVAAPLKLAKRSGPQRAIQQHNRRIRGAWVEVAAGESCTARGRWNRAASTLGRSEVQGTR